jgi:hypothetical protein
MSAEFLRANQPAGGRLELELGTDRPALGHLVSAASTFAALLREVAREYLGDEKAVRWIVSIEPGSVRLPVTAEPASEEFAPAALGELSVVIAGGLAAIDESPRRPAYFSNTALEQAKSLANLATDDLPIAVRNGGLKAQLTKRLMTHVDEVLGPPRESLGTVEGRLEAINIHGPYRFAVYDAVSGSRAECYFREHLTPEEVGQAIGKRVSVRGKVRTRPTGEKQMDVLHFRVFPAEEELPSADEVLGILGSKPE